MLCMCDAFRLSVSLYLSLSDAISMLECVCTAEGRQWQLSPIVELLKFRPVCKSATQGPLWLSAEWNRTLCGYEMAQEHAASVHTGVQAADQGHLWNTGKIWTWSTVEHQVQMEIPPAPHFKTGLTLEPTQNCAEILQSPRYHVWSFFSNLTKYSQDLGRRLKCRETDYLNRSVTTVHL